MSGPVMVVPTEDIQKTINCLDEIQAIAGIPDGTPVSEYAVKIDEKIQSIPDFDVWNPDRTWWPIEDILKADTDGYNLKYIMLVAAIDRTTNITFPNNVVKIKTSDGASYTGHVLSHTWDESQDKQTYEQGFPVYLTRWIMVCYDKSIPITQKLEVTLDPYTLYAVFDGVKHSANGFYNKTLMQSWHYINGANLHPSVTSLVGFVAGNKNLAVFPATIDTANIKEFTTFVQGCSSVLSTAIINYSGATSLANSHAGTDSLVSLGVLDFTNDPSPANMFSNAPSIIYTRFINVGVSLVMSGSIFWSRYTILNLFDNLRDMTGKPKPTITLGATNLAKVTQAEIDAAKSKNWNII